MPSLQRPPLTFVITALVLLALSLTGCNMPSQQAEQHDVAVTQAYQTVEALLTQGVAQTPTVTLTLAPAGSTQTATSGPQSPATEEPPTASPTLETKCDQAAAAYPKIDITIEDDTEMAPGESFTKVWRVVNVGTCTWTPDYAVVWFSGEQLEASRSLPLNVTVPPGQSVDISVDMVAPQEPGTYQSNWKLRNAAGELFGIGPEGQAPFWVRIKVIEIATETPTPTPTITPTPEAQASGAVTLVLSDTLDLDALLVNAGGVDLAFQAVGEDEVRFFLVPLGAVLLGVYGDSQPALSTCQQAALAAQPVRVDALPLGSYLCYRTDLGLPGWARLEALDTVNGSLALQILTWKLP